MIKKRFHLFICIISVFLLMLVPIMTSTAAENIIKSGDVIKVPIEITENPGICSARIKIEYDKNIFTMLSQENGDVFPLNSFVAGNTDSDECYAVWVGLSDINKTGTLLYIELKVNDTASDGEYTIKASYAEDDVFNLDEKNVSIKIENPVIVIENIKIDSNVQGQSSGSNYGSINSDNKNSGVIVKQDAKTGALDNFKKLRDYENNFADVGKNEWFYDYVKSGYEYKLVNGKSDTKFDPTGNITVAEAITLATNLRTIYYGERLIENSDDNDWYSSFVEYAIKNNIIEAQSFDDYDRPILRKEMARIFSNALPAECYENINILKDIPDIKSNDIYYNDIVKLYISGILTGDDEIGTFGGDRVISRSEAAAIVDRLAIPSLRIAR